MKTRLGFVSNSSTSSFVAFGYTVPGEMDSVLDKLFPGELLAAKENGDYYTWQYEATQERDYFIYDEQPVPKDKIFVGVSVARLYDCGGECLPIGNFLPTLEKIKKQLDLPPEEPVLMLTKIEHD
jgi:hypothetical protein